MPVAKDSEAGHEVVPAEAVEVFDPAARPASMPKRDAVKLTGRIKKGMDDVEARRDAVLALIDEAFHGKAWAAMGYASWQQYTATEFQMSRSRSYQLVNWAELNRELEAEGEPVAATEREARRTRKARATGKSSGAERPGTPTECLPLVDTRTDADQRERVPDATETVEEPPAPTKAETRRTGSPETPAPSRPIPPKASSAVESREAQVHGIIDRFFGSNPEKVAAFDAADPKLAAQRASAAERWVDGYRKAVDRLKAKGSKDPAKCQHPQSAHRPVKGRADMVECGICGTEAWSGVSLLRMGERAG